MKKLIFIIMVLFVGVASAQDLPKFEGLDNVRVLGADTLKGYDAVIIFGDFFNSTTKVSEEDTTLATKLYVDAGGAKGVTILNFDPVTGIASIATDSAVVDTADFNVGLFGLASSDTLIIRNDSLVLGNGNGVALSDIGLDSISTDFDTLTGILKTSWYVTGTKIDSSENSLDGRYVLIQDSTDGYVTGSALVDSLNNYVRKDSLDQELEDLVYEITLPIAGTLAQSVAAATPPPGWTLSASGGNLQLQHNKGRYAAYVTVWYNTSGSAYRQLVNWQTAYNTIQNEDLNNTTVISISEFYQQAILKVYVMFD